jgi:hypothetical protein
MTWEDAFLNLLCLDSFLATGKCNPQVNDVNFCAVFIGIVDVFGRHVNGGEKAVQFVKSQIDTSLQPSDPTTIHNEVVAIRLSDEFTAIIAASSGSPEYPMSSDNDSKLPRVAILLIVIACMLVMATAYYFCIQWTERNMGDTLFSNKKTCSSAFRRSYSDKVGSGMGSIRSSPSFEVDDVVLDGEEFEDEYGSSNGKSQMSHISQSTANSRRIETKNTNASLLQYSSRASSRSSEIEQGLEKW